MRAPESPLLVTPQTPPTRSDIARQRRASGSRPCRWSAAGHGTFAVECAGLTAAHRNALDLFVGRKGDPGRAENLLEAPRPAGPELVNLGADGLGLFGRQPPKAERLGKLTRRGDHQPRLRKHEHAGRTIRGKRAKEREVEPELVKGPPREPSPHVQARENGRPRPGNAQATVPPVRDPARQDRRKRGARLGALSGGAFRAPSHRGNRPSSDGSSGRTSPIVQGEPAGPQGTLGAHRLQIESQRQRAESLSNASLGIIAKRAQRGTAAHARVRGVILHGHRHVAKNPFRGGHARASLDCRPNPWRLKVDGYFGRYGSFDILPAVAFASRSGGSDDSATRQQAIVAASPTAEPLAGERDTSQQDHELDGRAFSNRSQRVARWLPRHHGTSVHGTARAGTSR